MRYFFCTLIFFFLSAVLNASALPDSLFKAANELYSNNYFEDAADTYHKILEQGYTSPEVLYNLGNAYFRSNKPGKARLYYEKALLLAPGDNAIKTNLAYTESLLTDRFDEIPVFFLRKWIISLRKGLTPDTWSVLALSSFLFSFFIMIIYLFSKRISVKKFTFFSGIAIFIISVICLVFAISASKHLQDSGVAILTAPSVVVKSAPRDSGRDLFILHEGAKVWLENKTGDWKEIRISDGRIGWLPASTIEKI